MFGKKEDVMQSSIANLQSLNSIGVGTIIDGNIKTDGDFRIDGKVNGNEASEGVYFYTVTAVTVNNKDLTRQGFFHLIRK